MYLLAKTQSEKDFSAKGMSWSIIPQHGAMNGFEDYDSLKVQDYPQLARRFPYTSKVTVQELSRRRLRGGHEYAIWISFQEKNPPDIAFALTIQSERGSKQLGVLPLN